MVKSKGTNTYRFKGFSERIGAIKIDVVHKIGKRTETPEDEDTFFCEALRKWTELNCTLHFQNFASSVKPFVQSLAQLVHHDKKVIELLKEHLQISDSLAVDPLLDLVVQLAKDLQNDFYAHFSDFFGIFVTLLNDRWQDADILECIFTTLSYLFKFLWRPMIKDINNVFRLYTPLLIGEQKYYIQEFAAESFSFLMRKMKDSSKLFDIIFSALKEQPSLCQGLGFMCFEMIKGVKNQFHSVTESVLPVLLSKLGIFQRAVDSSTNPLPWKMVFWALSHMLQRMARHTTKENCQVVEKAFLRELQRLITIYNEQQLNSDQIAALKYQLSLLLQLTDVWVSWNSGSLISSPQELFKMFKTMTVKPYTESPVVLPLLKLVTSFLLASFANFSGGRHREDLVALVFNTVEEFQMLFRFCRELLHWKHFREEVFPRMLICCQEELLKDCCNFQGTLFLLAEVVTTYTPVNDCDLDQGAVRNFLFFPKCATSLGEKILKGFLDNLMIQENCILDTNRLSQLWGVLVCLPCISLLDRDQCSSYILSFAQALHHWLKTTVDPKNEMMAVCVLSQAISSYLYVIPSGDRLSEQLDLGFVLKLLRSWSDNVHVLQACYKLTAEARNRGMTDLLCARNFQEIYSCLRLNLSSAGHLVRLLSLKILTCFDQEENLTERKIPGTGKSSIFEMCLSAEEIPAAFETYRDKLVRLQRLRFSSSLHNTLPEFHYEAVVLYLIGMFRVNFSPLWKPVIEIITSFAVSSSGKQFWKIFTELLLVASERAEKTLSEDKNREQPLITNDDTKDKVPIGSLSDLFERHLTNSIGRRQDNRSDDVNFRYLMWQAMASFPEVAEQRSHDVVPLFLKFMSKEYCVPMENVAPSQDIRAKQDNNSDDRVQTERSQAENSEVKTPKVKQQSDNLTDSKQLEAEELTPTLDFSQSETQEPEVIESTSERGVVYKKRRRATTKSLRIHLSLFTAFKNPKALYKEAELRQLLMTLLGHKEGEVQKLVMQCLFTYKFEYLEPYKKNLERLLGDENFRNELAHFSIDEENSVVEAKHRTGLVPVLIRLLYGKMRRSTGAGSTGKAGIGVRRSVVLRFLASCPQKEMETFMDLILAPFNHLVAADNPGLITTITDLSAVVPLKKQKGFLGMVSEILKRLGSLAVGFLPSILQIILSLLSTCAYALERREKVHPGFISHLKVVRQLAVCRLTDFFELMPDYDFKPICDAVFSAAVWPQIEKLSQESIQHPTPLLKLLLAWSNNPRYFPLLSRRPVEKPNLSIMSHVFACLTAPSVSSAVVATVMEMTDNLLVTDNLGIQQGDSDLMDADLELGDNWNFSSENKPGYGTHLVLPNTSVILEYLSRSAKAAFSTAKGKGKRKVFLPGREMSVLSKISPFVQDAKQSSTLITVLQSFLQSSQKEDTVNNILITLKNLLANVVSPKEFVIVLSKLFSRVNSRSSRQCLCDIFLELSNLDPSFSETASDILMKLNSWNPKRIEEPDYNVRLAAFSSAKVLIQRSELKTEEILPVLHNCIHFVLHSDDMSIRDSAGSCMSGIVRYVLEKKKEKDKGFHVLITRCLVPACQKALKSKNEPARNEFLSVLSMMIGQFENEALSDMKVLRDTDPEKDFFENIKHIQLHRRMRALRRLQSHCQQHKLRTKTLASFMLPLATHCVFDHAAAKEQNLVTEAITTIGTISANLPWSKYCSLLRHYLKLLPIERKNPKTIVRIVVAILNSFHFDLSTVPKQLESHVDTNNPTLKTSSEQDIEQGKEGGTGNTITEESDKEEESDDNGDDDNDDGEDREGEEFEGIPKKEAKDDSNDALALRIYRTITSTILPRLHKCVTKKPTSAGFHRLSRRKAMNEEQALRVPIILAMVKLLQALPQHALQLHLPGLLLRVCQALKSRALEVRDAARGTLAKIIVSLGTLYFPFVLKELRSSLTRGYQLHVLSFTLHSLLEKMIGILVAGDLDPCLQSITEVLVEDLFGEVPAEREVGKITNKLPEAKSSKSFDTFEILGKYVGAESLMALVLPLKEVLDSTQSHKTAQKVQEVLRRIGVGLAANTGVTPRTMLIFAYGLTNENVRLLKQKTEEEKEAPTQPDPRLQPSDTFLLPPTPSRRGNVPDTSKKTNHHILVEFGLQILYMMLKRGKISTSEQVHLEMLDPFVRQLTECLKSKYTKVVTISLRCVALLVKIPLPSLSKFLPIMGKILFKILKNYSKAGAKVGENFQMLLAAFKGMTVIIQKFKKYSVAEKHLQVLLSFVEEDIHDHNRRGTALSLLKAILSRKLVVPEIHDVMAAVSQLSITGALPSVQLQCRRCMLQFLLDYPLGNKLQRHLEFYVSQLSYEHESGRESALEMLASMFSSFPEKLLFKHAGFFFVPLASRLVNDDSTRCRKLTALAIKSLLKKLDADHRHKLFSIALLWFKDRKIALQRLAAQVCGLFVEVEGKNFERRLDSVLPITAEVIAPDHLDTEECQSEEDDDISALCRVKDHLLFNTLTFLAKVLKECQLIRNPRRQQDMAKLWESAEAHLLHPHTWVQLASSRLFGLLFAAWKPEELITDCQKEKKNVYFQDDLAKKVSKLCDIFCIHLWSPLFNSELGEQAVKNLLFLAKMLRILESECSQENGNADESQCVDNGKNVPVISEAAEEKTFTLKGLMGNLNKLATQEASQTPRRTQRRSCVLRWVAGLSLALGTNEVEAYLQEILSPAHRELDVPTTYKNPELQKLAQEVIELIKSLVDRETFARAYSCLQQRATENKETKKRRMALEAVADPAKKARKKLKRNFVKKEARKRKIDSRQPERRFKAPRMQES